MAAFAGIPGLTSFQPPASVGGSRLQEVASFINTIAGTAVQTIGQIQVLRQQPANLNTLAALQAQRTGVPQTAREPADESIRKVLLIGAALVGAVALYQWLQSRKRDS